MISCMVTFTLYTFKQKAVKIDLPNVTNLCDFPSRRPIFMKGSKINKALDVAKLIAIEFRR